MNKLKGYRNMLGLKQKDMSKLLSVSLQSYNKKENGKVPFNDKEKLIIKKIISEIYPDITIDEIFFN